MSGKLKSKWMKRKTFPKWKLNQILPLMIIAIQQLGRRKHIRLNTDTKAGDEHKRKLSCYLRRSDDGKPEKHFNIFYGFLRLSLRQIWILIFLKATRNFKEKFSEFFNIKITNFHHFSQFCLNILSPSPILSQIRKANGLFFIFPSTSSWWVADSSSGIICRIRMSRREKWKQTNTAGGKKQKRCLITRIDEWRSEESTFPFCTHYCLAVCGCNHCQALEDCLLAHRETHQLFVNDGFDSILEKRGRKSTQNDEEDAVDVAVSGWITLHRNSCKSFLCFSVDSTRTISYFCCS